MPSSLRSLLVRVLFAVILLFAQQVGMAHMVAHGSGHGPTHSHSKGVPTQACDECLAFAQAEPAPTAVIPALVAGQQPGAKPRVAYRSTARSPLHAFRSRAPPIFH